MSRKISIPQYYGVVTTDTSVKESRGLTAGGFFASEDLSCGSITPEGIKVNFNRVLPSDINIFSELPDDIYEDDSVRKFMSCLRQSLLKFKTDNITLSKLSISERSDTGVVFDWIFNYFRAYFSFDKKDGNYFGILKNDPVHKSFTNDFKEMKENEFDSVADSVVSYVIAMATA